jgi:outer membrane protein TolC
MMIHRILLLVATSLAANAQTRLSLTDALTLGLKNRHDLQASAVSVAIADNALQKDRQKWLPTLTASGNVRYNTQLQTTVLPAGFGGSTEAQRLAFGTRNSTVFSLDLTQPLYRPEASTDRAIAQNSRAIEQEKVGQKQTDVKIRIAEAYLNVLLRDLQRQTARADLQRYRAYFDVADGKHKLGNLPERDHLNAHLDLQNSDLMAQKAEQNYRSAQATLCYELNIPTDTMLVLTDRIDNQPITTSLPTTNSAKNERTEVRQLALQQQSYVLQSQKVLHGLKPSVSFYGNYSTQFLSNDFNYFGQPWNPFNHLGIQLSVPLSGQFTRKTDLQTYQLQARQTELNRRQKEADIANEIRQARDDFANALRNLQSTQASLGVARQLNQLQQDQHRLGTLLYTQVLDTEKSLQTAEQNHLEAAYSYLVARLNYEKAVGVY